MTPIIKKFPIVTICGSMRYYNAMLAIAQSLTTQGQIVLMPFNTDYHHEQNEDELKKMLDEMHLRKIDMSDYIAVVGSHVGVSTLREIEYAMHHGKGVTRYTTVDHLL